MLKKKYSSTFSTLQEGNQIKILQTFKQFSQLKMRYVFHRIYGSLMTSKNLSPGQSTLDQHQASGYRQARRTQTTLSAL